MSKRPAEQQLIRRRKNPLLQLIPNIAVDTKEYSYNNHDQWDEIESNAMVVFKTWYNDNNKDYKHIRHAFNSLCKHHSGVIFKCNIFKLDNKYMTTIWVFKSFQDRAWIYQVDGSYFNLISEKNGNLFIVKDEELKPLTNFLRKCL